MSNVASTMAKTLLAVHAHPDDETITMGVRVFSREDHGEVFENPETDLFAGLGQANSCSGRISQN